MLILDQLLYCNSDFTKSVFDKDEFINIMKSFNTNVAHIVLVMNYSTTRNIIARWHTILTKFAKSF